MVDLTILSDPTLLLTLFIVIAGVGLRTIFGMYGKPKSALNPNLIILTFIIAVPATIGIIAPQVEAIPADVTPTELLVAVVGLIMVVFGGDVAVKKVSKVIAKAKDNSPKPVAQTPVAQTPQRPADDVEFTPVETSVSEYEQGVTVMAGKGFDPNTGLPIQ